MLSASERNKDLNLIDNNDEKILKKYEEEFNINSLEAYYKNVKDDEMQDFRNVFLRYLYVNNNPFVINTKKEIIYVTVPRTVLLRGVVDYLDKVKILIDYNPNIILVLTNGIKEYKKIIDIANEKNILCMLISDNLEDKYLDNSNLYVQINKNPSETAKRFNLHVVI